MGLGRVECLIPLSPTHGKLSEFFCSLENPEDVGTDPPLSVEEADNGKLLTPRECFRVLEGMG